MIRLQQRNFHLHSHINSEVLTHVHDDDIEQLPVIVSMLKLYYKNGCGQERCHEKWIEHLHCHKQSLSPQSADIFRHDIFHYYPFMDRQR